MAGSPGNSLLIFRRSTARASPCRNAIPARLKSTQLISSAPVVALQSKLRTRRTTDTVRPGFTQRKSQRASTPEDQVSGLHRLGPAAVLQVWKPARIAFPQEPFLAKDFALSGLWAKAVWAKFIVPTISSWLNRSPCSFFRITLRRILSVWSCCTTRFDWRVLFRTPMYAVFTILVK